ncbi:hypothetical protein G6F57_022505 [Rhizopus arrhizus]|nr:hypothetical protein G6F57_022505 [Rhizopus arrhizus]
MHGAAGSGPGRACPGRSCLHAGTGRPHEPDGGGCELRLQRRGGRVLPIDDGATVQRRRVGGRMPRDESGRQRKTSMGLG